VRFGRTILADGVLEVAETVLSAALRFVDLACHFLAAVSSDPADSLLETASHGVDRAA
jgi:hypothetical protein